MTSYNKINGVWGHYNYDLCTTVLRGEWGYDGCVMTDWWMRYAPSPEFPAPARQRVQSAGGRGRPDAGRQAHGRTQTRRYSARDAGQRAKAYRARELAAHRGGSDKDADAAGQPCLAPTNSTSHIGAPSGALFFEHCKAEKRIKLGVKLPHIKKALPVLAVGAFMIMLVAKPDYFLDSASRGLLLFATSVLPRGVPLFLLLDTAYGYGRGVIPLTHWSKTRTRHVQRPAFRRIRARAFPSRRLSRRRRHRRRPVRKRHRKRDGRETHRFIHIDIGAHIRTGHRRLRHLRRSRRRRPSSSPPTTPQPSPRGWCSEDEKRAPTPPPSFSRGATPIPPFRAAYPRPRSQCSP